MVSVTLSLFSSSSLSYCSVFFLLPITVRLDLCSSRCLCETWVLCSALLTYSTMVDRV